MADLPDYDLGTIWRGDTWRFPTFVFPVGQVDLTGAVAQVDFRRRPGRDAELGDRISSAGDEAVLALDPDTGELICAPYVPALGKGAWYLDLQLIWPADLDPRGKPKTRTYCTATLEVSDDRTE